MRQTALTLLRRALPLAAFLLALPLAADWLVTDDGERIDINGRWTIDDQTVRYTDADGNPQSLPRDQVDLEASSSRVVLYSTSWCGYCRRARRMLDEMGVDFVEKDIEKSRAAAREFQTLVGRSGVPVLNINGSIVRGFNEGRIRQLVEDLPPE